MVNCYLGPAHLSRSVSKPEVTLLPPAGGVINFLRGRVTREEHAGIASSVPKLRRGERCEITRRRTGRKIAFIRCGRGGQGGKGRKMVGAIHRENGHDQQRTIAVFYLYAKIFETLEIEGRIGNPIHDEDQRAGLRNNVENSVEIRSASRGRVLPTA